MSGGGIRFAVGGIDFENAIGPRRVVFVVQQVDGEMNRHGVQRFAGDRQRLVGLLGGGVFVVVFEREIGELLVRFVKLRIEIGGLLRGFHGVLAETLGLHLRDAEVSLRVLVVDLEGLFETDRCASSALKRSMNKWPQRTR